MSVVFWLLSGVQLFCDPMDYDPPDSSVHGILGKNTGMGHHFPLQGIFGTQRSNPHLLHCRQILYHWAAWEAQWYERN